MLVAATVIYSFFFLWTIEKWSNFPSLSCTLESINAHQCIGVMVKREGSSGSYGHCKCVVKQLFMCIAHFCRKAATKMCLYWQNYILFSFHIEWDMIVVTVFLSIFWIKLNSIWFKIERKTVTTIISHSVWKEMEI